MPGCGGHGAGSAAYGCTAGVACDVGLPFSIGMGPVLGIEDLVKPEHVVAHVAMLSTYSCRDMAGTRSMTANPHCNLLLRCSRRWVRLRN
eukprot:384049-Amphidinium_carterae.2